MMTDDEFKQIDTQELFDYMADDGEYEGKHVVSLQEHCNQNEPWRKLLRFLDPTIDLVESKGWPYFKQRWGLDQLQRALTEYNENKMGHVKREAYEPIVSDKEMYLVFEDRVAPRNLRVVVRQYLPAHPHGVWLNGKRIWLVYKEEAIQPHYVCHDIQCERLERGVTRLHRLTGGFVHTDPPSCVCCLERTFTGQVGPCMEEELTENPSLHPSWYTRVERHTQLPPVLVHIIGGFAKCIYPRYEVERSSPRLRWSTKRVKYN